MARRHVNRLSFKSLNNAPKGQFFISYTNQGHGIHTVVFLRHGESTWNVEQRFTGWCDIPLTNNGEYDAIDAGKLMSKRGLEFDVAFTSTLERAWRTCALALAHSGDSGVETIRHWRLNERHYGALQGHYKNSRTLQKNFGTQTILDYRRSWEKVPPALDDPTVIKKLKPKSYQEGRAFMHPKYWDIDSEGNEIINEIFPKAESLQQCQERAYKYWEEQIAPQIKDGKRVLIVAHANTIRALVKRIDDIDDSLMPHLKIPNGIPIVYTLDNNLTPILQTGSDDFLGFQAKYLMSPHNHEKMMAYETCTRKKMTAIFQFLDHDNTGYINATDLYAGLMRIQEANNERSGTGGLKREEEICEFEVEELLRRVPTADAQGRVTLEGFIHAGDVIEHGLTNLRLLQ